MSPAVAQCVAKLPPLLQECTLQRDANGPTNSQRHVAVGSACVDGGGGLARRAEQRDYTLPLGRREAIRSPMSSPPLCNNLGGASLSGLRAQASVLQTSASCFRLVAGSHWFIRLPLLVGDKYWRGGEGADGGGAPSGQRRHVGTLALWALVRTSRCLSLVLEAVRLVRLLGPTAGASCGGRTIRYRKAHCASPPIYRL